MQRDERSLTTASAEFVREHLHSSGGVHEDVRARISDARRTAYGRIAGERGGIA
jgi:hypothetical protein